MSSKLTDVSPNRGVYEGDLKYGRCNGNVPVKHKDFSSNAINGRAVNKPLVPLVLRTPRDPDVWTSERDRVKKAKKKVDNFQSGVNHWIESFQNYQPDLKSNIHLTVGRQRL